MRFLADMGISMRVVAWLRQLGHDVVHLREQGLQRLPDHAIFEKADLEDRIVLTFDLDFSEIAALRRDHRRSLVLFRLRDAQTANVIAHLGAVLPQVEPALQQGAIVMIEDHRHRVRILPIGR